MSPSSWLWRSCFISSAVYFASKLPFPARTQSWFGPLRCEPWLSLSWAEAITGARAIDPSARAAMKPMAIVFVFIAIYIPVCRVFDRRQQYVSLVTLAGQYSLCHCSLRSFNSHPSGSRTNFIRFSREPRVVPMRPAVGREDLLGHSARSPLLRQSARVNQQDKT